jgi:sugar (pentulose or hexulose) kinase
VWAQLRADALGLPHDRVASADTCPVGAALLAAIAIGLHDDLASAAAALPPPAESFEPRGSLDEPYTRYRTLVDSLARLAAAPW